MIPVISKNSFAYRDRLKSLGCTWDGRYWQAPDAKIHSLAMGVCNVVPPSPSWSLTVYGDAGFRHEIGIARWAWSVRGGKAPFRVEGSCQGEAKDIQEAEGLALLYGVRAGLSVWPTSEGTLYLRSDNLNVIQGIHDRNDRIHAVATLLGEVPKGVSIDAKHVPGHGKSVGVARWMNARVDAASHLRGWEGDRRVQNCGGLKK